MLPDALAIFAERNGDRREQAVEFLKEAADRFAGLWIVQRAAIRHGVDFGSGVRGRAGALSWRDIVDDSPAVSQELSDLADLGDEELRPKVRQWIDAAIGRYAEVRESDQLWMQCSGKQVVSAIAPLLGLADAAAVERQTFELLADGVVDTPQQLSDLRQYIDRLSAATD